MSTPMPDYVRACTTADVAAQRVPWHADKWRDVFAGYEPLHDELTAHVAAEGGIARQFVHERSDGDPVALFLLAMAWGFGPTGYGAHRTSEMLGQPDARANITTIVETTRSDGALGGWMVLMNTHKVPGLNMAFGTKLLYCAGYSLREAAPPLVLDANVRKALLDAAPGLLPEGRKLVRHDHYLAYLQLAEEWAADPTWAQEPDAVEYALFQRGS
jgi:hypothetical protein